MNTYENLCIHSLTKIECKRCKYKCIRNRHNKSNNILISFRMNNCNKYINKIEITNICRI